MKDQWAGRHCQIPEIPYIKEQGQVHEPKMQVAKEPCNQGLLVQGWHFCAQGSWVVEREIGQEDVQDGQIGQSKWCQRGKIIDWDWKCFSRAWDTSERPFSGQIWVISLHICGWRWCKPHWKMVIHLGWTYDNPRISWQLQSRWARRRTSMHNHVCTTPLLHWLWINEPLFTCPFWFHWPDTHTPLCSLWNEWECLPCYWHWNHQAPMQEMQEADAQKCATCPRCCSMTHFCWKTCWWWLDYYFWRECRSHMQQIWKDYCWWYPKRTRCILLGWWQS